MSIRTIRKEQQGFGQFNGGAILENKPIGFPGEGGDLKPYSNLFYWAHAWSDRGSVIGEHPHQGFEIMSFVLKGKIEHYDSMHKKWLPLEAGDVQIIRAGNGISHAERLFENTEIFQIWVDPDLSVSLGKEAGYNDYKSSEFETEEWEGFSVKILRDGDRGIAMDTPGMIIRQLHFEGGNHRLPLDSDLVHSMYLLKGKVETGGAVENQDSFFVVRDEEEFTFSSENEGDLFIISSPGNPGYRTYASRRGWV